MSPPKAKKPAAAPKKRAASPAKKPAKKPLDKPTRSKPAAKKTRKATSERKAASARANGALGGRPKKHRYEEVTAALGPPPDGDQLELCNWAQKIAATLLYETLQGRGCDRLNREARGFCQTIQRLLPTEKLAEVAEMIKSTKKLHVPAQTRGPQMAPPGDDGKVVRG